MLRVTVALLMLSCGRGIVDPDPTWYEEPPDKTPKQAPAYMDPERRCPQKAAGAVGTCRVDGEGASRVLIHADIAAPGELLRDGHILIEDGKIACVDCECDATGAVTLTCPGSVVTAGLINGHDHLTWAGTTPKPHGDIRYDHRNDWRTGAREHTKIDTGKSSTAAAALQLGELRFVMSGATSTVSSGAGAGFLRNLDRGSALEGLEEEPVVYDTFPVGSDPMWNVETCAYEFSSGPKGAVGFPHVSEGVDAAANNEFKCLTSTARGGIDRLNERTAIIHGVGLRLEDVVLLASRSISVVWSARTNVDLYGFTADVVSMSRYGVNIAIGTDWLPSGSMNMSRELACIDGLNRAYFDNWFTDGELVRMATENGAIAAHMSSIGALEPGRIADIAMFSPVRESRGYRAVLESNPESVALVMRGGKVLYGDDALVSALEAECDVIDVCEVPKRVCAKRETGTSLPELIAAAEHRYPLFNCGAPQQEPSCVPYRAERDDAIRFAGERSSSDLDGDGIADTADNCPRVFNPARPLDGMTQPDFDGDGQGDVCDMCPMLPDSEDCF